MKKTDTGKSTIKKTTTSKKVSRFTSLTQEEQIDFLTSILSSSTEYSIVALDLQGMILSWNEGARRLYGYDAEEVLKKHIDILHEPEDIKSGQMKAIYEEALNKEKWNGEIRRIRKNKEKFVADVTITVRKDANDKPVGYTLISRDISKQKKLEQKIREQMTKELQSTEFLKQVQQANRLKSEFLANMSHELRTPLNGIIGFAELMFSEKVGPLTPLHKEYLGDILSSSRHLLQLINDILDLAKVEAGKMEFHPETINFQTLINEVRDILRTLIAKKQIKFSVEISESLSEVVIDPSKFKQVLYNYISNAIKFTPLGGGIKINIISYKDNKFKLEVKDTGIGIRKEDIGKLFNEFKQINSSDINDISGTGLGLALTRRIVEAQGGEVGVESDYGSGSNFFAILPKIPDTKSIKTKRTFPKTKNDFEKRSILVIEDDENDQASLARTLHSAGFTTDIVGYGKEAIYRSKQKKYDAITLDLILPDMSGWDLLHTLRTEGLNLTTPVFLITVVPGKKSSYGLMVNDYLTKPLVGSDLIETLKRYGIVGESSENDKTKNREQA